MEVEVVKFDNNGHGIAYLNDKIIFIPKTVVGDIVEIEITLEKNNYCEGRVIRFIEYSKKRVTVKCPFYNNCGGCDLMHISYSDMLDYKLDKINNILNLNKIDYHVDKIIKSTSLYNYRNKVTLKIENGIIGFYKKDSHEIVEIDNCMLCKDEINNIIKVLYKLELKDASLTIRCNYNNDILLIIESQNELSNIEYFIDNFKIVGIILNDKTIYGDNYFMDKIGDFIFKVSYNSFFQVNPYICEKLFELISYYTNDSCNILDFYSGVGTLSIVSSKENNKTIGVEIVENAILDANLNKCLNKKNDIDFICSDTKNITDKITSLFDTIILDPPRSGCDKKVIDKIIDNRINKIIYVSCNPFTLARDLNYLKDSYEIENITILDMFPNTEHVESVVILEKIK